MKVTCPTCQTTVEWNANSTFRPFCSKRCQLIDLGEWANEEKAIPCGANKDAETEQLPEVDIEDVEAMLSQQDQSFFKPH